MFPLLYKIVEKKTWQSFILSGHQRCYGFEKDIPAGYIHMSTLDQLPSTAKKFVNVEKKNPQDLAVMGIHVNPLAAKWEKKCIGANCKNCACQAYPHFYGPLECRLNLKNNEYNNFLNETDKAYIVYVLDLLTFMRYVGKEI